MNKLEKGRLLLEQAYDRLDEGRKALLPYPMFTHSKGSVINFSYRGLNSKLEYKRQNYYVDLLKKAQPLEYHLKQMVREAGGQRNLQKMRADGFRIELPIKALIEEAGMSASTLIETIRDRDANDKEATPLKIGGLNFHPSISMGVITGNLILDDDANCRWSNNLLLVQSDPIPDSLRDSLIGQTLRRIVDHHLLEGLTVRKIDGKTSLRVKVHQGPVPAGAFDVL